MRGVMSVSYFLILLSFSVFQTAFAQDDVDSSYQSKVGPYLTEEFRENGGNYVLSNVVFRGAFDSQELSDDQYNAVIEKVWNNVTKDLRPTGFRAYLTPEDTDLLARDPNVAHVGKSFTYHTLLDDVVEIIDAVSVWDLQIAGIPLTGVGQTVAIIDLGIASYKIRKEASKYISDVNSPPLIKIQTINRVTVVE